MEYQGKTALRQHLSSQRDGLKASHRAHLSQRISSHLVALPDLRRARCVALYRAMRSEVDLQAAALAFAARGVACVFPRVAGQRLEFAPWSDPGQISAFGVAEPIGPAVALSTIDGVVCPGLGFDRQGNRLGYGQGYYDRALLGYGGVRVGVTFGVCLQHHIPHTAADQPVRWVITEDGCFEAGDRHG